MKDKVLRANVTNAVEKLCHEMRAYSGESMVMNLTIITRAKGAATPLIKGVPDWFKANIQYTEAVDKDDSLLDESARIFYGPDDFGAEGIVLVVPYQDKAEGVKDGT